MRTYRRRSHPLTRGLRLLCVLALLTSLVSTVEAQERRYLLELGAGGLYQTFGEITRLDNAFGGVGRVGLWLPYNFSVEVEGAFASSQALDARADTVVEMGTRTITGSVLYNILLGKSAWAHLRVGGGSTKYNVDCVPEGEAQTYICGSSGAILGGAGLRIGLTPDLLGRGDLEEMNVGRQRLLEPARELVDRHRAARLQMRDLGERMDAGVGAARAAEIDAFAHRLLDRAPELARDRPGVLLLLPAAVARALVLERQLPGRHAPISLRPISLRGVYRDPE